MRTPALLAPQILSIALMMFSVSALGAPSHIDNTQSSIQITFTEQKDSAIRLEARQAPLGQILKKIAAKTGAIIHYSVLPEAPVSATCVGANVGQIMDCLVAKQVGLVAHKARKNKPAEFWLLGSSVGSCQAVTLAENDHAKDRTIPSNTKAQEPDLEQSDSLVEQFKSAKNAETKMEALFNIASGGNNDANVQSILDSAITDKDASIRAQAYKTMASLDKKNAAEVLGRALGDSDQNVRLAAVDAAENDIEILEQAIGDNSPTVREYAEGKLEILKRKQKRKQE